MCLTSLKLTRQCGFADAGTMREVGIEFGHAVDVVTLSIIPN